MAYMEVYVCGLIWFHIIYLNLYICVDVVPMFAQMHYSSVNVYIYSDTWMYLLLCMYAHIRMIGCSYLVLFLWGVV